MGLRELADSLREARRIATAIPQLTASHPRLTVAEAYEIQRLVTAEEPRVGWKMGMTSLAKQREMGLTTPIRGVLVGGREITNGGTAPRQGLIHPRAEPEIVFVLDRELTAGCVRAAIRSVHIGMELIDSRYRDFKFTLPDVIADNTSASGYVLGDEIRLGLAALSDLEFWIARNGVVQARAPGSSILGDPLRSLSELIHLTPEAIGPGVVLAGGVTQSIPISSGDLIEVGCASGARASFRVT